MRDRLDLANCNLIKSRSRFGRSPHSCPGTFPEGLPAVEKVKRDALLVKAGYLTYRCSFGARDRPFSTARACRRAKSIIGVSPVLRNDGFPERQAMPRKKTFNGRCPRPHRQDALAQCRIGFQPVSPERDEPSEVRSFAISIANIFRPRGRLVSEGIVLWTRRQDGSLSYIAPSRFRPVGTRMG
jgi:hypothetical protein